ncbi:MAG: phosphate/phosphite/phosphonate ABC transporter substrate-binding protein [Candidatus Wallbacteria bacterium]|nr:phosphate/phosphite/phosphonate ABC transporter substrate-binding protein [Candidatus Wallbacteria bacterium]
MFRRHTVLALVLLLGVWAVVAAVEKPDVKPDVKPLRLGCVAFAKESSAEAYRQVQAYLAGEVGREIVLTVYPNYHDVIADLVNDQLELAVLPPLVYLNARRQRPLDTLAFGVYAATGNFSYRSLVLVPRGSPAKTLADLAGRRLAFVDIMSASGYVLPKAALVQAGVRDKRDVKGKFYDNHIDAVRAVLRGDADGVATYDMIYSDSSELAARKAELRTLWTGDHVIPSDAVVATGAVPSVEQKRIRTALLSYYAAQQKQGAQKNAMYEGFVPADPNLYSDLERFLKAITAEK